MTPVFSRKSFVFLLLGVFALLFLGVQSASAVTCLSYGDDPVNPEWRGAGTITGCTIQYDDPTGGANLSVCKYRILSNGVQTVPTPPPDPGWTDASGICSGNSATLSINISIGAGLNCKDNGLDKCEVQFRAEDNAGNSGTGTIVTLDIDYTPPAVTIEQKTGQADPTNVSPIEFTAVFSESVTGFTGSDVTITGTAGGTKTVTVTGSGTTYNVAVGGMTSSGTVIATIPAGGATDAAGNGSTVSTSTDNTVTYDITAPTITNVSSDKANGSYTVGEVIDIDVTFSEVVTSTGNVTVTLETGTTDRTCVFTVSGAATGTCDYTVQVGDTSADLTVASITGTIKDVALNTMTNFVPTTNLAANKAIVVDTIAPTVTAFSINDSSCVGAACPVTVLDKDALDIAWTASDNAGGSGVQRHELWRAPADASGSPGTWAVVPGKDNLAPATTSTTDNPAEGTYWYGIHTLDNAGTGNCITETAVHCGGAGSDAYDAAPLGPRTVRGSIKVVMDKTAPNTTITSQPANPSNSTSASFLFISTEQSGSTFQCQIDGGGFSFCDSTGIGYSNLTQASHAFEVKATDTAGNPDLTPASYTWVVDTTASKVDAFDVTPKDPAWVNIATPNTTVDWSVSDAGGANLKQIEVWRAVDVGGSPNWGNPGNGQSNPVFTKSSGFDSLSTDIDNFIDTNLTTDGAYWYGLHVKDRADNCITEEGNLCAGGVPSDGVVRADLGPIKVIVDKTAPGVPGTPTTPTPTNDTTPTWTWNPSTGDPFRYVVLWSNAGGPVGASITSTSSYTHKDAQPLTEGTWYMQVKASDVAGNQSAFSDNGQVVIDITAPTVTVFTINTQSYPSVLTVSSAITVVWEYTETGGSGFQKSEVWRAWDANGDGNLQGSEWNDSSPSSGIQANPIYTGSSPADNNPPDGTYWYGAHIIDNAQNCITEAGTHCGGPDLDTPDPRTVRGPIKVIMSHNQPPTSSIYRWNGAEYVPDAGGSWQKSNFTRYIYDTDPDGSVASCTSFVYATDGVGSCITGVTRTCVDGAFNTLNLSVSSTDFCQEPGKGTQPRYYQGEDAYNLYVMNTDDDGAPSEYGIANYNIDWDAPVIQNNFSPAFVQEGVSTMFSATVSDSVELNYCWLYKNAVSVGSMEFHAISCNDGSPLASCPGGSNCIACKADTLSPQGIYPMYVKCADQYDTETNSYLHVTSGSPVNVQADSLSVDVTAIPSQGSTNTQFKLKAVVSGTMEGNINYKFDCGEDGTGDWDLEVPDETQTTYTTGKICSYVDEGIYTARVFVERGVGTAQDTVNISVGPNIRPEARNLQDNNSTVDYCFVSSPPINLSWEFYDEDPNDSQTAYQVQLATNPGFDPIIHDSCDPAPGTCDPPHVAESYAPSNLFYNTTYYWRVKVWDLLDFSSQWSNGNPFTTPAHPYPIPSFTWNPTVPGAQESVQFTDQTNFDSGATNKTWSWTFGDGGSSTAQNPTHTYAQTGVFGATLQSGDDVGSCSSSQTVNVSLPFPEWQEISPF